MKRSFTLRDLPAGERPRERLISLGPDALSTQELLALILSRGSSGESVLFTAQRLLAEFKNLRGIADASIEELCRVKGIGPAKACQLKAALELYRRLERPDEPRVLIHHPGDLVKEARSRLKGKRKEYFLIALLDSRNRLIRLAPVSVGSLDATLVHPREVFKEAISASAASVIFIHNHPSGDPEPSDDDITLTRRLVEVGKLLEIRVLDHIIIGEPDYLSLCERGYI